MKVAQVVCVYPPYRSGIGHVAQLFARLTAELGHQSTVFTTDYRLPDQGREMVKGVAVKRFAPFLKYGNGAFVPQLANVLRGIDIAYLHYPYYGGQEPLFFASLTGLSRAKILIHYHMDTPGLDKLASLLSLPSRLTSAALFKRAVRITCASLDYAANSNIRAFYDSHREKFSELPFAVDTTLFHPVERVKQPKSILFVSPLDSAHTFKGLKDLMEAFKTMKGQGMRLRIVGHGDMKASYELMAKKYGIMPETVFLGRLSLSGLVQEYQNAGVLVLPSTDKNEAFGLVLIEAMACATPVVASDLPGVRKVFNDGIQGYLSPAKDPSALASRIALIFSDPDRWQNMAKEARKTALERYSLISLKSRLAAVYDDAGI